jgi:hypothetical protein
MGDEQIAQDGTKNCIGGFFIAVSVSLQSLNLRNDARVE